MKRRYFIIAITFAAALAIGAPPASAQRGGGGHMGGGHPAGGHVGGGHPSGGHVGGGSRPDGSHVDGGHMRGGDGSFHGAPHDPGRFDHRVVGPQFRGVGPRFNGVHGFGGPFVHLRVVHPFHGPFFAFQPRANLGFGLFLGYPVPYPWDYVAPYPYAYPYYADPNGQTYADPNGQTYSESDDSGNSSTPSDAQRDYGGISFDITPGDASVYVDGTVVGTAQSYSPSSAPLTLTPGLHHVVIVKPGYQSMTFDSDVSAGQVIPYQGTMQPQ
jgi:hypothetical protein